MYERFFGFRERPFELAPDPRYLLLTPRHREALSNLEYGVATRKAITVLTGEAGTGKTTLVRHVLRAAAANAGTDGRFVQLANPRLTRDEFVEYLTHGFRLPAGAASSKARFLIEFERTLHQHRAADLPVALIIDEAHSLPYDLLEEIRLLVNIESDSEKLLPVILVGQPELADRLNEHELRQLKQRVALRCHLAPLSLHETGSYIAARVSLAGGNPAQCFTREAVLEIHRRSRGIPRTINVLCDNALVTAFALERRPVDAEIVCEVAVDFDLVATADPPADAPVPVAHEEDERPATPPAQRRWFGRTSSDS
jgi:general secretion pathway protein A